MSNAEEETAGAPEGTQAADVHALFGDATPTIIGDFGPVLNEVRGLVEAYHRPTLAATADPITNAVAPIMVCRDGVKQIPPSIFDDYLPRPRFRHGTATLTSLDSLIEHIKRFSDHGSVVFANDDRTAPSLTAVLDYHPEGDDSLPRFGKHRSHFAFPLSDEWKAWTAANGKHMTMGDFAMFVEDRGIDVLDLILEEDDVPENLRRFVSQMGGTGQVATSAKLIELSRGLRVNENSAVKEVLNLSTGEGQVLFQSEHTDEAGRPLRIPTMFLIGIPVFRNGPLYRVAARLRYRKQGGIMFWYDLWRADRIFDDAFNEACARVAVETRLPLLFGKPE